MAKKKIKKLRTGALSRSFSLARLGLEAGASAAGHALGSLFQSEGQKADSKKQHWLVQASRLARELGELKGSLMKAGQMLSVFGEHFLPPEINQALRVLQSDSPPVEWKAVEKVLARSLGAEKLARLEIDEEQVGAASLGQVHRARVKKSGEILALKIQYPGVERAIDGDIKALRRLLSLTEWLPKIPATEDLFEEVRAMLKREVNYALELEMLEFYGAQLREDRRFVVPRPVAEFSGKRVLAMSFEEGVKIDGPEVAALSQTRRNHLAVAVLELYFRELFEWRRVQTDPHFGNYRVRVGEAHDRLVLYDFGAIRDLPQKFMQHYREMLTGIFHHERARFERGAFALGVLRPEDPPELKDIFFRLCHLITEPFLAPQPYDWKNNDLPKRVSDITWEMVRKFPLRAPPREIVFLDRKLAGVFTLLSKLGAKMDARKVLEPYMDIAY